MECLHVYSSYQYFQTKRDFEMDGKMNKKNEATKSNRYFIVEFFHVSFKSLMPEDFVAANAILGLL